MMAVIGLNLRATLGAIPPLLNEISADLNLNATMEGLLTSIAVICMGICAPIGQRVAARRGAELTTVFILATLALGGFMRLAATSIGLMVASIMVTGAAMGAGSALVPGLIRHHAPKIRGTTTGIYSSSLAIGVALAAGLAVPSSDHHAFWGSCKTQMTKSSRRA
jgi:CP family cyanate transporter-like MFS transporter